MGYIDFLNTLAEHHRITLTDTGVDSFGNPVAQPLQVDVLLGSIYIRINPKPRWKLSPSGFVESGSTRIYADTPVFVGDILVAGDDQYKVTKVHPAKGLRDSTIHHYELDTEIMAK